MIFIRHNKWTKHIAKLLLSTSALFSLGLSQNEVYAAEAESVQTQVTSDQGQADQTPAELGQNLQVTTDQAPAPAAQAPAPAAQTEAPKAAEPKKEVTSESDQNPKSATEEASTEEKEAVQATSAQEETKGTEDSQTARPVATPAPITDSATSRTKARVVKNPSPNLEATKQKDRISGPNRYSGAVEFSKAGWNQAPKVYLANGEKFADSLTGTPLAALTDSPMLLTRQDKLPSEVLSELKRLNTKEVVILGSQVSVSDNIKNELQKNNIKVSRISGRDRHAVAANVANEIIKIKPKVKHDFFVAEGWAFADSLSVANVAAKHQMPILLTKRHGLHQTVKDFRNHARSFTILGSTDTIPSKVEQELRALGVPVSRIGGRNRYAVNRNVIEKYQAPTKHYFVASGELFSDALPASLLANKTGSGLLLAKNDNIHTHKEQYDFLKKQGVTSVTIVGGPPTLSNSTLHYFKTGRLPEVKPLVFLDPGHGGSDPGAHHWGLSEKDLNLKMSRKIKDRLGKKGYRVMTSRDKDVFVKLDDRAIMANNANADIFLSLHFNSMGTAPSSVHGIETFYYKPNPKYPSVINKDLHDDPKRLADSKRLATVMQQELIKSTGAHWRRVDGKAFRVIKEAKMPAALLEFGFMSNRAEWHKIQENWYQNVMADAVVKAVDRYFAKK